MSFADDAQGTNVPWNRDLCRIALTFRKSTFADVKSVAIANNRSISAEIRTMVEAALMASKEAKC
jgi:hypothetical protein